MTNKLVQDDDTINPLNDYLFKHLFGKAEHKQSTLDFLNRILNVALDISIKDIVFKNVELPPSDDNHIMPRLDVLVETDSDEWIDIEVQTSFFKGYDKRLFFYAASLYVDSIGKGDIYDDAKKVIIISLLDFIYFKDIPLYLNVGRYRLDYDHRVVNNDLPQCIYIEIPKLVELIESKNKKISELSKIERLLLFLSNQISSKQREELALVDSTLKLIYDDIKTSFKNKFFKGQYMDLELERRLFKRQAQEDVQIAREETLSGVTLEMIKQHLPLSQIELITKLSTKEIKKLAFDNGLTI